MWRFAPPLPTAIHRRPLLLNVCLPLQPLASLQVQFENPPYSRGIRQRLANASAIHGWMDKYKIVVGE